ncbi:MAG TPA: ABC transporter permease subunit [Anaerolineales bacterium]|nr:ABC transporter permease subunit [Anaerolineae bacterium]HIQ02658.1 ABC transporter permease subunit [Anaerolineales bacterium]
MGVVWLGVREGLRLLLGGAPYLWQIIARSVLVSGAALAVSALLGLPLGAFVGLVRFPGRRLVQALIYTGMGLPPVVVGLAVYLLLSRNGILGPLDAYWVPALFTPEAMVVAQVVIATPLVTGFTMTAVAGVDPDLRKQVEALGATRLQATWAVLREARLGVLVSLIAGLGSIISEVGAVMMVGGNIEGSTRVLTTAILLETRRGNFDLAIGLGLVLLGLSFLVNLAATQLQGRGR